MKSWYNKVYGKENGGKTNGQKCRLHHILERGGGCKSASRAEYSSLITPKVKSAFTLAEVLITLAIIGIVAAMTIPALVTSYQKKITAVRVKKAYAELVQVIKLSEVDNGNMAAWDFGTYNDVNETRKFLEKYILPYYKNITECSTGKDYSCGYPVSAAGVNYQLDNGLGLSFLKDFSKKTIYINISLSTNKGENTLLGRDAFYFEVADGKVFPAGWYNGITREAILNDSFVPPWDTGEITYIFACKKLPKDEEDLEENIIYEYRHGCTALLFLDNWEFKDDYPW